LYWLTTLLIPRILSYLQEVAMTVAAETPISSTALREAHGVDEISAADFLTISKVAKIAIAADGEIHPAELKAYLEVARSYGATDEMIDELREFDPTSMTIEEVLGPVDSNQFPTRGLLYDVIKIAKADGDFATEERDAVRTAAELLLLDEAVVNQIVAQVELEEAVLKSRRLLLQNPLATT
jgi:uncharacterized tellurite resistance protein B-like protein